MPKKLPYKVINIKPNTPEWLDFRKNFIGASEISTILGLDSYIQPARYFEEKVGVLETYNVTNCYIYAGNSQEKNIIDNYFHRCHILPNGDIDYHLTSYNNKNNIYIRKAKYNGKIHISREYPFLGASPDFNIVHNDRFEGTGLVECKTILSRTIFSLKEKGLLTNGFPTKYILQCHAQMLVTGADYVELWMLVDGAEIMKMYIEKDLDLQKKIIGHVTVFWSRVKIAKDIQRELKLLDKPNKSPEEEQMIEQYNRQYQALIPPVDYRAKDFDEYMDKKFEDTGEIVLSDESDELYQKCLEHLAKKEELKKLEKEVETMENEIKFGIGNNSSIVFGEYGEVNNKLSGRVKADGTQSRIFKNKVKSI